MKNGGNVLINKLFEANLTKKQSECVKPDKHTELDLRSNFIYDKYQHRKWYDANLAKDKSIFEKALANGTQEKRVSTGEFDDFFALRTKGAASDTWHDSNDDLFDDFNPRGDSKTLSKKTLKNSRDNSNSTGALSAFDNDVFNPQSPGLFAGSAKGGSTVARTPKSAGSDGRASLVGTLQRMDSQREILNTIRGFNIDQDNQILQPRQVVQSNRRKKARSPGDEVTETGERRRGSNDGETKPRVRQPTSAIVSERSIMSSRRQAPDRTRSNGSDDGSGIPRRRGSDDGDTRPRVRRPASATRSESTGPSNRKQGLSRTKSIGSDDGSEKPRRRIQRSVSDESYGVDEESKLKEASSRPRREPRRGVSRTRSMGTDSEHSGLPKSVRSKSAKRGVRRTASNDDYSLDGSMRSYDADASQLSTRSTTRRPPRRPRQPITTDIEKDEESKPLNDSLSSGRRRRSPKRSGNEVSTSRTPSPVGGQSRLKNKLTVDTVDGNTISLRRVPTVRDRSPKPIGFSPASRSKRPVELNIKEDIGNIFAAT